MFGHLQPTTEVYLRIPYMCVFLKEPEPQAMKIWRFKACGFFLRIEISEVLKKPPRAPYTLDEDSSALGHPLHLHT